METNANYKIVGAFVLGFILFIIAFLIWISGVNLFHKAKSLDIVFSKVSGLNEGSPVRFQGLHIGSVRTIKVNPLHPKQLLVNVSIDEDIPLKTDVVASVDIQGITGTSFIQLTGGSDKAPNIRFSQKNIPQIVGRDSSIDKVIDNAPELLNEVSALTTDIKNVVSEENREAFKEILFNVKELTDALKSKDGKGGHTIGEDIVKAFEKLNNTLDEIHGAAKEIRLVFAENREGLKAFTGAGLTTLTKFLGEAQVTFAAFKRVIEAIERSPTRFLHNDPDRGVRLK